MEDRFIVQIPQPKRRVGAIIRLQPEAVEALQLMVDETGLPVSVLASEAIKFAA